MKFLIIRFSSIGDIVLTTPVVRCLKKQVATAEVHYLTKASYQPILSSNPYIDKIHVLQDRIEDVLESLRQEDFDYVIDLHHNLRTMKVKRALKKKSFSFSKLNIEKWLLTALKIDRLPNTHIVDRYMDTLKSFGVKNDGAGLDYFIPDAEMVKENDIPASHQAGYIGLVIGAAYFTKRYPLQKWQALCQSVQHPIILMGGPEDKEQGDIIAAVDRVKIYNACGKFSLNESADLVRRAKLIVSNDTGLMHIASAFKRPVISLWGNTVPQFGMYPYYGENFIKASTQNNNGTKLPYEILEVKGLSCRPCSKIGYKKCPKGHFKCMELIDPMEVENKLYEFIAKKK
jgi:ADP-heptose:LPS heptosyltransferase